MVWIFIGSMIVSLAITYAWWTKIRIQLLRQDIYDLRDQLFDHVARLGSLNDPAYKEARGLLNASAASADYLSLQALLYMNDNWNRRKKKELQKSNDERVQKKVDFALMGCASSISRYLMSYTLSGWVARLSFQAAIMAQVFESFARTWSQNWDDSSSNSDEHHLHGGSMRPA